jgi:flagellar export protein FliJ
VTAYPLDRVVAYRARAVDAAAVELRRALGERDVRRAELAGVDAAVANRTAAAADAGQPGPADAEAPGGLAARARWSARLRAGLAALVALRDAAARAAAEADGEVEARRRAIAEARAALRAVELHRDGWRAGLASRRDRREQEDAEDLVSARTAAR